MHLSIYVRVHKYVSKNVELRDENFSKKKNHNTIYT